MTSFSYRAARPDGRIVTGTLVASNGADVDVQLLAQGLHPMTSELIVTRRPFGMRVSARELAVVFRSLASLVSGGVPVSRAVAISEALPRSALLRTALKDARRSLIEGRTLSEALTRDDAMFPPVVLGMLRAGERGSRLAPALEQAATQLEEEAEMAGRLQQALAYPLVLLLAGTGSVLVISTLVVPRFAVILSDLGQSLPRSTRLLLFASTAVRDYGLWALAIGIVALFVIASWASTPAGRERLHSLLLRIPVIGSLRLGFATARICRAMGGLLETGVPVVSALAAARDSSGDAEISRRLQASATRVTRGEPIARALEEERAMSPVALQLIAIGESSGQLAIMSNRAAAITNIDAQGSLRSLVTMLEPTLVVLFGGMVAFTAVALLQAVYSLRPG